MERAMSDNLTLTDAPFVAKDNTIWQGSNHLAMSRHAKELVDLLNAGLAAKKGEK
jgi:hypothetical protein